MNAGFLTYKLKTSLQNRVRFLYGIGALVAAIFLAYFPIWPLLGVASAAPLLYVIIRQWVRQPWTVWLYLAALLPILSFAKFGPASAADALIAVAIGLWLVHGVRQNSLRISMSLPAILFSLYASVLLLAFFNAVDLVEAFGEVVKWIELWIVLVIAREMIPSERMPWLVGALLLGGFLQGAIGLGQFIFRIGPSWFVVLGQYMRASGTFSQPNPYAGYLGLCLPVALSLFLWTLFRPSRNRRIPAALFVAMLVMGIGLISSWSRGGWLGAASALAVVLTIYDRRNILVGGAIVATMVAFILLANAEIYLLPKPIMDRFSDVPALLEKSSQGIDQILNEPLTQDNFGAIERAAHWSAAIKIWDQSPWFGAGPGNYAAAYPDVVRQENRLRRWDDPLGHAHNVYLNVLAEGGVVGLVLYLFVWGAITLWVWSRIQMQSGFHRALAVGVFGVLIHLHVHNSFDNLFVQGMYLHIGLWLTALLYNSPQSQSKAFQH